MISLHWAGLLCGVVVCVYFSLRHSLTLAISEQVLHGSTVAQVTMRVNSFRRLDLLEFFLDYYKTCAAVKQIQVVWSDQRDKPPVDWLSKYPTGKVLFEVHDKDSLNNRFVPLQEIPTETMRITNLRNLNLSSNLFNELPHRIDLMRALEVLDVSGAPLKNLPSSMGSLLLLRVLKCNHGQLEEFPASLGSCASLTELQAYQNIISDIPPSFKYLTSL
jgi:hypothetical protein